LFALLNKINYALGNASSLIHLSIRKGADPILNMPLTALKYHDVKRFSYHPTLSIIMCLNKVISIIKRPSIMDYRNILNCGTLFITLVIATAGHAQTKKDSVTLPAPYATKSVKNFSKVIGWKAGQQPVAPSGFTVTKFADSLENPRWIYVAPNGDIFVSEAGTRMKEKKRKEEDKAFFASKAQNFGSANRITLFRDKDKDGIYESKYVYITGLNQPFGMLILKGYFYVANTDNIIRFPYHASDTAMTGNGMKIINLLAGGYNNHWTRNIITNPEQTKLFVSVGSSSNDAKDGMADEQLRANILEINPDGTGERVYASGLRNPCGMDWLPGTHTLWTTVNERDELGDDLVPDYTTAVKEGGFYGWPFCYFGKHVDPLHKGERPDLVAKAIVPDVSLGSHTASLGLVFYKGQQFPAKYHNGLFIGQHGSWNRSELAGYKVVFIPFKNGKPSGKPEDFLTGFIADAAHEQVYGRPVGVAVLPDGSMLVADDAGKTIWRVSAE
jgi:glucose/arabinose dehydrogenase